MASKVKKRKARSVPWSPLDQWEAERHINLEAERKKAEGLQMKIHKNSERKLVKNDKAIVHEQTYLRKDTSSTREKRRKWVDLSLSGRKLNLYLDSLDFPMHLSELLDSGTTDSGILTPNYPRAYRVRGLPLVHFIPILIAIKDPAKRGMFTVTQGIAGTNTDQYYLKNQDHTLTKCEAVFLDW